MAKRYFVKKNRSWKTWEFLKLHKYEPTWQAGYLAAKAKRRKQRVIMSLIAVAGIMIAGVVYSANRPTQSTQSAPAANETSSTVAKSSALPSESTVSSTAPVVDQAVDALPVDNPAVGYDNQTASQYSEPSYTAPVQPAPAQMTQQPVQVQAPTQSAAPVQPSAPETEPEIVPVETESSEAPETTASTATPTGNRLTHREFQYSEWELEEAPNQNQPTGSEAPATSTAPVTPPASSAPTQTEPSQATVNVQVRAANPETVSSTPTSATAVTP